MGLKFHFGRWLAAGLLLILIGCRPPAAPPGLEPGRVNGAAALEEARALAAIRPRDAGTPGAQPAAEHLLARLRALGIQAALDAFEDECPGGRATFRNVQGVIPAAQPAGGISRLRARVPEKSAWVVLGSHYDTKEGIAAPFAGANDSASSSGLLLELARLIQARGPLPFNVLIAFFDGEECRREYGPRDGLHGSRRLAGQLVADGRAASVRAVIILDMVGDRDLNVTLPRNGTPALMSAAFRAAEAGGVRDKFSLYRDALVDDHQPFLEAGMPAVDIIDFEYGSAPGRNDYWHTPADDMDKLSAESLAAVGRVVVRMLNEFCAGQKIHNAKQKKGAAEAVFRGAIFSGVAYCGGKSGKAALLWPMVESATVITPVVTSTTAGSDLPSPSKSPFTATELAPPMLLSQ